MAEKSTGQWIGAIVGAVVGYFTAGLGWYATAASMAQGAAVGSAVGGLIDPPKGPEIFGPRLSDLSQQMSSYGAPIPRVYGSVALMGNVFWIENNSLKETSDTEGGGKGGGGSEVTTYSYSATFALGLCQGEIAGVRRIWISGKLIYDAGSDDVGTIIASNASSSGFRIHNGSATQMPDSRMQAALGVANTPAYRGLAYIVFDDLQLADYGNTLVGAQIKVEVLSAGTFGAVSVLSQTVLPGTPRTYGATALHCTNDGLMSLFLNSASLWVNGSCSLINYGINNQVSIFKRAFVPANNGIHVNGWSDEPVAVFIELDGTIKVINEYGIIYFTSISPEAGVEGAQQCLFHQRGNIKLLCTESFSPAETVIRDLVSGQIVHTSTAASSRGRVNDIFIGENVFYSINSPGHVVCYDRQWSELWAVDMSSTFQTVGIFIYHAIGGTDGVLRELADGVVVLSAENKFWKISSAGFEYIGVASSFAASVERHGGDHLIWPLWISYDSTYNKVSVIRLDKISNSTVPLSGIVEEECLLSSVLSSTDLDTASLTDAVRGYRISATGAIRGGLEPLQGAYPFDVIQSGYKIKFSRRTSLTSLATVTKNELGARPGSDDSAPSLVRTREMDTQIPAKVTVTHLDISREYDVGEQYAERLNTTSINEHRAELALVMSAAEAAQLAETLLYMYWLERQEFSFTLPPTYRMIEPGDVITVDNGTDAFDVRLTSMQYRSDGVIECSARPHRAIYTSTALGADGPLPAGTISLPGQTEMVLLDIPTLVDVLDVPGFAVACAGYFTNWPGCVVFRSTDAGMTWSDVLSFASPSTIGYTAGAMTAPADSRMIDKASTLSVKLFGSGTLSSVTEGQMLNGANHFAYGSNGRWEIISAQNAVLQGDGTYLLSDMLRGRFGTEWAMGTHQAYDRLVLLNTSTLQFMASPVNGIGLTYQYRAVTFGKQISSADSVDFAYAGENLECLSPVYLNGNRHPTTNDWSLTWLRRTRVGGEWRSYVDASLGEASEAYEVEIYSSGAYTTLKRTITGLTSAACAYTSAEQVTDFGSNQATLYVKIYQLSANVGRGQPLTTSITR